MNFSLFVWITARGSATFLHTVGFHHRGEAPNILSAHCSACSNFPSTLAKACGGGRACCEDAPTKSYVQKIMNLFGNIYDENLLSDTESYVQIHRTLTVKRKTLSF